MSASANPRGRSRRKPTGQAARQPDLICNLRDLTNEASVEALFVNRLIFNRLGYADSDVQLKQSIDSREVRVGRKKVQYKPDYIVNTDGRPRWLVDAKAPDENLDDYVAQCASYSILVNGGFDEENPLQYFVLTNGALTRVYRWDNHSPILEMSINDFDPSSPRYADFAQLLSASAIKRQLNVARTKQRATLTMRNAPVEEIKDKFSWCHQYIYNKGNISQAAGFEEFVKVVFLKLLSDKRIRQLHPNLVTAERFDIPLEDIRFSRRWIDDRNDTVNPISSIQYKEFLTEFEVEIERRRKKRIFRSDDTIRLSPEIIYKVVETLERYYLLALDVDINGRLFETFLGATMRGKDLGQFFTPESVVKLGTALANFKVGRDHCDTVLDPCCGTGGFLITALADLWKKIDENRLLSAREKQDLRSIVANRHVVGIDIGRDPNMARIARMNMYLHGDGGSRIYEADALDKALVEDPADPVNLRTDLSELRTLLHEEQFDVILTNPPFAKTYDLHTDREAAILKEYAIAAFRPKRGQFRAKALSSSIMFLERYHDLLKPGGRVIAVIDDGVLGGDSDAPVREFIRSRFIVKAVVSLPGDAFQRSQARVKTSIIVLEKADICEPQGYLDRQGPVFMYACRYVGIDDPARKRTLPVDRLNRQRAREEIAECAHLFRLFEAGDPAVADHTVEPEKIADRMDVKSCSQRPAKLVPLWEANGLEVYPLSALLELVDPADEDIIDRDGDAEPVTYLRIRYDGFAERGDEIVSSDSKSPVLVRVHAGDVVISNINAIHGAVCVVPKECDGCVVTSEFTVCRAKESVDPKVLWLLLRSPEARADLLLLATGIGRTRVRWGNAADLRLPTPPDDLIAAARRSLNAADRFERMWSGP
ncbi:N-6 DNA methylase [Neoroseomonas soli]|uniref:N-6 DNA methylase n=1 Tax=Neoroseomonas soli TaxID=1081025 RepID=A0A9X9WTL5_9PROT|nr:N-6 DNA methylase [Neoroseomonas soli]MBR0670494.1 N-6 DNA methylase [Neoroseomonas soli]